MNRYFWPSPPTKIEMPFLNGQFYIITVILQAICVIHCLKKRTSNNWIWLIVFLPLIGCLIYFFSEILTRSQIRNFQSGFGEIISPSGSIKKLEDNLRFSDTFQNRISLADAYLMNGRYEKAIELYESSLNGVFSENEYVLAQLVLAYKQQKRYSDIILCAEKIYNRPQFQRSKVHIFYAVALAETGMNEKAEKEFLKMNMRFSNFEARFYYSQFLESHDRKEEAINILLDIVDEFPRLTHVERKENREWFSKAKNYLNQIRSTSAVK
jgi:hypothetical protein